MARRCPLPHAPFAAAVLLLTLPTAASARKNAWQVQSLSGQWTYHATAKSPLTCSDNPSDGTVTVLSRNYSETFRSRRTQKRQYAAKYFPFFRAPQTNGPGQNVTFSHQRSNHETFRTFTTVFDSEGNPSCVASESSCAKDDTVLGHQYAFSVNALKSRTRVTLNWQLGLGERMGECAFTGASSEALAPEIDVVGRARGKVPDLVTSKASTRSFRKRVATFRTSGTLPVNSLDATGTLSYSAVAKIRKIVIADGCKEVKGRSGFVCTL